MFVGAAGFAVAFIANYQSAPSGLITLGSSNVRRFEFHSLMKLSVLVFAYYSIQPVGTAHFAIGIVVMLMHIANVSTSCFKNHLNIIVD